MTNDAFIEYWNEVALQVHLTAIQKGWWDSKRSDGEIIALIHSELSEALEASRLHNPPDRHIPEFSSLEVELADAVIRIMDFTAQQEINLAPAILAKMEYNKTRPVKHGGKAF